MRFQSATLILGLPIALLCAGCRQASSAPDDELIQETVDEAVQLGESDQGVSDLKSEIADLEQKLADVEAATKEAKDRADEAHDLADEADSKANNACKPYGYQPGCGNSGD